MTDLRLEREFNVTPDRLFEAVSTKAGLLQWWGPETTCVSDHQLDFSRTGPWFSTIENAEGQRYKMSGQVTHVDRPNSIGFTWAWHDEADNRGCESHVTFTISKTKNGANFVLDHRELESDEQSERHEMGWTSSLRKLAILFD
ncbi:MAG: SRPBCC domain-containing protein [Paracoccaceae bacterium]